MLQPPANTTANLPDLCAKCGVNKSEPDAVVTVRGASQSSRATLRGTVQSSMSMYAMDVRLCRTCYEKYTKERNESYPFVVLGLVLFIIGLGGLAFGALKGLPSLLMGIFGLCLVAAIVLAIVVSQLYDTEIGGWKRGGWWFKNPTYEREFSRLNPKMLTTERRARLMRISSQNKKE